VRLLACLLSEIVGSKPVGGMDGCRVVCCQIEISATGRLPVQRSPSDCGLITSTVRRLRPIAPCYAEHYTVCVTADCRCTSCCSLGSQQQTALFLWVVACIAVGACVRARTVDHVAVRSTKCVPVKVTAANCVVSVIGRRVQSQS
jgi:hypothetical protein